MHVAMHVTLHAAMHVARRVAMPMRVAIVVCHACCHAGCHVVPRLNVTFISSTASHQNHMHLHLSVALWRARRILLLSILNSEGQM